LKDPHDTKTLDLFPLELTAAQARAAENAWGEYQLRKWKEEQRLRVIFGVESK
jgi:hypothetical protein